MYYDIRKRKRRRCGLEIALVKSLIGSKERRKNKKKKTYTVQYERETKERINERALHNLSDLQLAEEFIIDNVSRFDATTAAATMP